eukprot:TRINITY_DN8211_c0_g1_i2.p2 TRINITY_DN8211_c0_g1~~TRINITY_DN8211_c0_g1_i2.p2  ORF type:complete len:112 (-),score=19.23 TRINITY_DN8211_c0_g1_i2:107-442(-)
MYIQMFNTLFVFFFFFKQKTAYEMQRGLVGSEMCIRDRIQGPQLAVWALSLLTMELVPHSLTAGVNNTVFGVKLKLVGWWSPAFILYSTPMLQQPDAIPKYISGRTRYFRV